MATSNNKPDGLQLPRAQEDLTPKEQTYLMESQSGMLVRVPESKLDRWQAAQEGKGPKPTAKQRQLLKDRIRQEIYGSKA